MAIYQTLKLMAGVLCRAFESNDNPAVDHSCHAALSQWWRVFISAVLPVTLVPMMSGRGISSGRSLQLDTSDSFLCCSRRIFCLFCLSAVRSSAKNADEHLGESTGQKTISHTVKCLTNKE